MINSLLQSDTAIPTVFKKFAAGEEKIDVNPHLLVTDEKALSDSLFFPLLIVSVFSVAQRERAFRQAVKLSLCFSLGSLVLSPSRHPTIAYV